MTQSDVIRMLPAGYCFCEQCRGLPDDAPTPHGPAEYPRVRYGVDGQFGRACGDCGVPRGQVHVLGCDMERCPACGRQLITCELWGCEVGAALTQQGEVPC
jgi:hypothetical protein